MFLFHSQLWKTPSRVKIFRKVLLHPSAWHELLCVKFVYLLKQDRINGRYSQNSARFILSSRTFYTFQDKCTSTLLFPTNKTFVPSFPDTETPQCQSTHTALPNAWASNMSFLLLSGIWLANVSLRLDHHLLVWRVLDAAWQPAHVVGHYPKLKHRCVDFFLSYYFIFETRGQKNAFNNIHLLAHKASDATLVFFGYASLHVHLSFQTFIMGPDAGNLSAMQNHVKKKTQPEIMMSDLLTR